MFYERVEGKKVRYGTEATGFRFKVVAARGIRRVASERAPAASGDRKSAAAISRARSVVYGLAMCNDWDWFCTFTLDRLKYDRFALDVWRRDFCQFLRNQRRLHGGTVSYLLVPERHHDGAWHMHGFMSGLPCGCLSEFDPRVHPLDLVRGGFRNWAAVSERFGYCSLAPVRSHHAAAGYITKYLSKGLAGRCGDVGEHLYFASRGLQRPEVVFAGSMAMPSARAQQPDYSDEWCRVWWFDARETVREVCEVEAAGFPLSATNEPEKRPAVGRSDGVDAAELTFW